MRVACEYRMASRENYTKYREQYPDKVISYYDWANVIYTFNYNFRDYLLETGYKEGLPWGTGYFAITKKKMRVYYEKDGKKYVILPVNWQRWKETGKRIFHTNEHTEGFKFKMLWFSNKSRFAHPEIWNFDPYRETSRLIAHYVTQEDYQFKYQEW
jgi:hypothetical protein